MRSNHPEKTQRIIPQDPLWVILFLRLESPHLRTSRTVVYSGHDALLRVKTKLFSATRERKGQLEVCKRLTLSDDLLLHPVLSQDDDNIGSVLSPHVRHCQDTEK